MPRSQEATFHPSPRLAAQAPRERLAYVTAMDPQAALGRRGARRGGSLPTADRLPDGLATVDLDPASPTYGTILSLAEVPTLGDELRHAGWNACSSALCPRSPRPQLTRRYLLCTAARSSRIFVFDVAPDPRRPRLHHVIPADPIAHRAGYSRPRTLRSGPDGIYVSALGSPSGGGPGGIFVLDGESFEVLGRWEIDRADQHLHGDFGWHLGHDVLLSTEWGTPDMVEGGLVPELLLGKRYGHRLHVWDLRGRRHLQALDLGAQHQMALEVRPAHDPTRAYGFVNSAISVEDLSASVWLYHREGDRWAIEKVITLPTQAADAAALPPLLAGFGAVPPLATDIALSLDDRFLYVACWGTGELRQYDVGDPHHPRLTGAVRLGGVASRASHPGSGPVGGAPQRIEISRDGRRVYFTSSLCASWDEQIYPEPAPVTGWMAMANASPEGGLALDPGFFVDFGARRAHQIRLAGGDASSDSFCYP